MCEKLAQIERIGLRNFSRTASECILHLSCEVVGMKSNIFNHRTGLINSAQCCLLLLFALLPHLSCSRKGRRWHVLFSMFTYLTVDMSHPVQLVF